MVASSADREVQIAQLRADRAVQIALFRYRMQRPGVPLSEARSFRISLCTDGRISFYNGQLQWTRWHGSWELNQKTIFMRFHWNGDERNLKLCVCAPQAHAVPQNVWLGMDYKGRRVTMEWWCVYNSAPGFEPWGTDWSTNALVCWMIHAQPPTPPRAIIQPPSTASDAEVSQDEPEDFFDTFGSY